MEKTKAAILERLQTERRRLVNNLAVLATLAPERMEEPGVAGPWSVKDLLAHLAEWEALCLGWVTASRRGESPAAPAPGFTWRNLDPLNQVIYDKYHDCSLDEVMELFHSTHLKFYEMAAGLSEEEMLQPGFFAWCKGSFYDWIGGFGAHDAWGKKLLRGWMKAQKLI